MSAFAYKDGMAEEWIGTHATKLAKDESVSFAITLRSSGALVGAIGLELSVEHSRAELGYWIGKQYWGQGIATEAAREIMIYGFEALGLRRIYAHHIARNPASGRVMAKIGMKHEGTLRQHIKKWGFFEDAEVWGITSNEIQDNF
jgi:[ribosomal protein S5]-alanine N-acetyltransferase